MKNRKWVFNLVLNYISLIFIALSTLIVNSIFVMYYDTAVVGRFNVLLTWLLVLGQIGTLGIHQAVMCYAAQNNKDSDSIINTAFQMVLCISIVIFVIIEIISGCMTDEAYQIGVALLGITAVFSSINKVILGYFNGMDKMQAYAYVNLFRSVLFVIVAIAIAVFGVDGRYIFLTYTISELLTMCVGLVYIYCYIKPRGKYDRGWAGKELKYGIKIMPSMISTELKSKGCILLMGFFLDDTVIGIYSFAILFVEGFYQLYVILRLNMNPKFAVQISTRDTVGVEDAKHQVKKLLKIVSVPVVLGVVAGYYVIVVFMERTEYLRAFPYLVGAVTAISIVGYWIIVLNTVSFAGKPEYESVIAISSMVFDAAIYIVMILLLQEQGLIIASFVTYLFYGGLISLFLKRIADRKGKNETI